MFTRPPFLGAALFTTCITCTTSAIHIDLEACANGTDDAECNYDVDLHLLQRSATPIGAGPNIEKKDKIARQHLAVDDVHSLHAQQHATAAKAASEAAERSVQAAAEAAQAVAKVVHLNAKLVAENQQLRMRAQQHGQDPHTGGNVAVGEGADAEAHNLMNGSIGLLVSEIIRTVPQHRVDEYNSVAVDREYHNYWQEILTFPERRPWATNVIIATAKTFLADLIVQMSEKPIGEGSRFCWRRSLLFIAFGCLYVGMAQWFFYISMFSKICPDTLTFANEPLEMKLADRVGQEDLLIQVLVDQFFITPFVYFPIFYTLKEVVLNGPLSRETEEKKGTARERAERACHIYIQNFRQDNLTSLAVWFPADFVIFTAPMYLRMPMDHGVAFLWTMIMSYMRGGAAH